MEFLSDVGRGRDRFRPSFFELAAQDQLNDLLSPVLRYVLSVFAQRNPRYLLGVVNRHDEFFAVIMFFIERHHLNTWGGSFAESFYGLKRRKLHASSSEATSAAIELTSHSDKLGKREVRASLVTLVLIPYLRCKASEFYESIGGGSADLFSDNHVLPLEESQTNRERIAQTFVRLFKKLYPYANLGFELYLLTYNIRYIFERTPFWRPWLSWMNVQVRRLSPEDYKNIENTTKSIFRSPFRPNSTTNLPPSMGRVALRSLSMIPLAAFETLKYALPTAIFFFRFLEWWYSPEGGYGRIRKTGGASSGKSAVRAPPKPKLTHLQPSTIAKNVTGQADLEKDELERGMCVVHRGEMVNPTALPTGWMGCYKCIHKYVEENGTCPVEGTKVTVGDIRKIIG